MLFVTVVDHIDDDRFCAVRVYVIRSDSIDLVEFRHEICCDEVMFARLWRRSLAVTMDVAPDVFAVAGNHERVDVLEK